MGGRRNADQHPLKFGAGSILRVASSRIASFPARPVIFLMLGLLVFSPLASASQGHAAGQGPLAVGSFAVYSASDVPLDRLAGYSASPVESPIQANKVLYLNGSWTNPVGRLQVMWRIDDVLPSQYLVNYTVAFVQGDGGKGSYAYVVKSTLLLVDIQEGTAYYTNLTKVGTWPYWLPSKTLNPGADFVPLHDYPSQTYFPSNDTEGMVFETPLEFVSLPQGRAIPNGTSSTFLNEVLDVPSVGRFRSDRLLVTYPYLFAVENPGVNVSTGNGSGPVTFLQVPSSPWVGVYDRLTGILLGLVHVSDLTDDVLLHAETQISDVGYVGASLLLTSTNVPLVLDSAVEGGVDVATLGFAVVSVVVAVTAVTLYLRRRAWRK